MKVMVFVKATKDSEAGVMPSKEMLAAMGAYNQSLIAAGILKDAAGLKPTLFAKRVRFSGTNRTVIDGPFAETNQLVAGYWLWEVKSVDEALDWIRKCPNPMLTDSDIDLRPLYGPEDFG